MNETKYKILLVEDDKFLADIYVTKLEEEGFDVYNIRDGSKVLEAVKEYNPDLLMLDIILPNMDGWEVFRQIRNDEKTKDLKVVVFSNLDQAEDYEKAKELGALKYLVKAKYTPVEVVEEVKKILYG